MNKIELERKTGDFGFEVKDENGHVLHTDSSIENGGGNDGFRPMQLMLAGLGACSAIDMVSILKKQRQTVDQFKIKIAAEREQGKIPSLWKSVAITFELYGKVDAVKAKKAADLSMEKHCSVAETLRRGGTELLWKVKVINTENVLA